MQMAKNTWKDARHPQPSAKMQTKSTDQVPVYIYPNGYTKKCQLISIGEDVGKLK